MVRAFEKLGWQVARQRGSHIILTKTGSNVTLSIPDHAQVARGTLRVLISKAGTPGCETLTDGTALIENDAPQPDVALRILPARGGQSRDDGPYLAAAPELVVEVAASGRARDLGPKSRLYLAAGVREYITALVEEEHLIWRELKQGQWHEMAVDGSEVLRSRVFPGR